MNDELELKLDEYHYWCDSLHLIALDIDCSRNSSVIEGDIIGHRLIYLPLGGSE